MLGLGQAIKEILGKLIEHVKRKKTVNFTSRSLQLYIQGSFVSHLFALCFLCKEQKWEKTNFLDRKHEIICFMFHNNFFHKNTSERAKPSRCFKKGNLGVQDLMFVKCYFQHGTMVRTVITCKKNSFLKVYWVRQGFDE